MAKNKAAVALGNASWRKRKKNKNVKDQLSKAGKASAVKRAIQRTLDKAAAASSSSVVNTQTLDA